MDIIVNLDVMMAKRKISSGELAERVGITPARIGSSMVRSSMISPLSKHCKALPDQICHGPGKQTQKQVERRQSQSRETVEQPGIPILRSRRGLLRSVSRPGIDPDHRADKVQNVQHGSDGKSCHYGK